jgi:hypothetical protein
MSELVQFAERVLGPCTVVADCSWEHRMSAVLRLRDQHGTDWFLKRHRDRGRYETEVMAYRTWVPALGNQAPALRARDDALRALILSAVPGSPAPWPDPVQPPTDDRRHQAELTIQRQAGAALRRLHQAEPARPWPDFGPAKIDELDRLILAAASLVPTAELDQARAQVRALAAITTAVMVPCHRDYTPRNWLVHDDGLAVIDFEWARLDAPASDLSRLHLGIWADRPDLAEAFAVGYGQPLGDTDRAILHGCALITAIWLTIKARETAQPSFEQASRAALSRLLAQSKPGPGGQRPMIRPSLAAGRSVSSSLRSMSADMCVSTSRCAASSSRWAWRVAWSRW